MSSNLDKGNKTVAQKARSGVSMGSREPLKDDSQIDGFFRHPGTVVMGTLNADTLTFEHPVLDGETIRIKDIILMPAGAATITVDDTNYFKFKVGYTGTLEAYAEEATAKLQLATKPGAAGTEFSFKENDFFADYDDTKDSAGLVTGPTLLTITCTEVNTSVLMVKVIAILQQEFLERP